MTIPTCCITGYIAGDSYACGDCDPCILGASQVPEPVKKLIGERDEWASKYAEAMEEREGLRAGNERLEASYKRLRDAAYEIYWSANWKADREVDHAALWDELRDALEQDMSK